MAISKTVDNGSMDFNLGLPDIKGGGLPGSGNTNWKGGLAGAIGAAIAGATAAIGGAGGTANVGGGNAALPKNPIKGDAPLIESETAGTPPKEPAPEEEPKEPIVMPSEPTIKDETDKNTENPINSVDMMSWLEEQQKKQWEREDTIRKETQAREDNAYQRAVTDMQKAGINPNLMNVQAAASGGGITQATGMNYEPYQIEMDKYITLLEQEIDNAFKEDENAKDRFADILGKFIQTFSFVLMMKRNIK